MSLRMNPSYGAHGRTAPSSFTDQNWDTSWK